MSDFPDPFFEAEPLDPLAQPLPGPTSPAEPAVAPPGPPFTGALSAAYLETLNPPQREAVESLEGPLLVLAGAGTGKTRVLTTRLAHLLLTGKAQPYEILAVTFTNKAAREMRERVTTMVPGGGAGLWLGTFHALAARILRRHPEIVGLKDNFTILDTDDQLRLLKQVMESARIDSKRWPARQILGVIERWKDRAIDPDRAAQDTNAGFANGRIVELYRDYQARLQVLNAVDFGDLLTHNLKLFASQDEHGQPLVDLYRNRFRYLLVDEYQDTNIAQYLWLRALAMRKNPETGQAEHNICCVGDEDQSIYGWRGAEVGNILRFETDFPGAQVVRLEQNYRSSGHILAAASRLIGNNENRYAKTLWTEAGEGEKLRISGHWDHADEARSVGEKIEDLQRQGHALSEITILVRAGFQTREFEERFLTLGLPYRVFGGLRFYERMEIRDAIAYLRVLHSPADGLAFERILNKPKRGIGATTLRTLHEAARATEQPLSAVAAALLETDELRGPAKRGIKGLLDAFDHWRRLAEQEPPARLAEIILDESGYTAMWQADKSPEAPGRLENLKELINAIDEFDSLAGFLEHVALVTDNQEALTTEQVTLMSLHAAKGLEFDTVFLCGWEEGLFPHQRALDQSGAEGLEEERRLAYVGLTRARRRVFITWAANRRLPSQQWQSCTPSRFLNELPAEHCRVENASGLFGGPRPGGEPRTGFAGYGSGGGGGGAGGRRTASQPPLVEGKAVRVGDEACHYGVGDRVFHQKFGYGQVSAAEGDKLEVVFDRAGAKRVMAGFVIAATET